MPTLTTTIEDTAPVIVYSVNSTGGSDWSPGSSSDDKFVDQYSQSSYMVTDIERADVSFTFFGTGVQLYGAKRSTHGLFQISIDSVVYPPVNGSMPNDAGTFQFPLFSTVALTPGWHTVRMTNLEAMSLDIDFITYQTLVGSLNDDSEALLSTTIQDYDLSFVYSPSSEWSATPANIGMFSAGSGHVTGAGAGGANVEFTFEDHTDPHIHTLFIQGDSVALFGPVSPSGAPYSVQLDDGSSNKFSAQKAFYRAQQMLFSTGNLGGGKHVIRIQSQAANNSASTLAIDFAEVFTTPTLQHSNEAGLSTAAIVGIAIGVPLAIILPILYFFYRRRQKPIRRHSFKPLTPYQSPTEMDVSPPIPNTGSTNQHLIYSPSYQHWLTPTPGMTPSHESFYDMGSEVVTTNESNHHTWQTVTVPFTADGKYRPDLSNTVQLQDPPGGARRPSIRLYHYSPPAQTSTRQPSQPETIQPLAPPGLTPLRKT